MTTLTYNDFYSNMGLVGTPMMNPLVGATFPVKAWIGMGNRPHGDNLSAGYKTKITGAANYADLTTKPWQDVTGWIYIHPAAENTCTNAVVLVYDFQVQWFDTTQNAWKLASATAALERVPVNQTWWTTNTFAGDGNAEKIYTNRNNIPRFSNVKLSADRSAASSDTSKYRLIHNGISRAPIDWTKVGGITVMCRARLEPISGSLNGVPSIFMHVGGDYNPKTGENTNQGVMAGVTDLPAIGAGQLRKLELTEKTFLFTTAKINPDTYIETTSNYVTSFPAGTYPQCMTDSVFAANVPQFIQPSQWTVSLVYTSTQNVVLGPRPYVPSAPTGVVKYVTPTGAGSHNGSSFANAMTVSEANAAAVAGDHYWLQGGTYANPANGTRFYNGGTSGNYVTYESYQGGLAVFDGSAASASETMTGIKVQNPWIRLINIEQKNSSMEGVQVTTSDCVLSHIVSHNNRLTGIQVSPGYGYPYSTGRNLIQDCTAYANSDASYNTGSYANGGNADGIQVPNGKDNIVEYCLSYGNSDDGFDVWRSTATTIRNCISHDNGIASGNGNGFKGGGSINYTSESHDHVFDHCLSYNNKAMGFDNNSGVNCTINHMTCYGNTGDGFYFENTATATNNVSANNGADMVGVPAVNSSNTWNIGGTPTFLSTTPGDANFLKLSSSGGYGTIGCFYS